LFSLIPFPKKKKKHLIFLYGLYIYVKSAEQSFIDDKF